MALRQSDVLDGTVRVRDAGAWPGPVEENAPAPPRPAAEPLPPPPEAPRDGGAVLARPPAGQGGPLPGEPEMNGSLIRALFYAVPVALGGWALIGAVIWSLL